MYGRDIFSPHTEYCKWVKKTSKEILFYRIQKDLLRVKPFLEERADRIAYQGVLNKFELQKFPHMTDGCAIVNTDVSRTNLAKLADRISKTNCRLLLLSFKLSKKNLNPESGRKIETFLRTLKSKRVNFIITKPLPRCLFNQRYEEVIKEFRIPRNCEDCLELFVLKGNSFHVCNTNKELLRKEAVNRKQIYEFFRKFNKKTLASPCAECIYLLRGKCAGLCL
jgi:hypothetical protein